MSYSDIRDRLFNLIKINKCPQSFLFYGENINEIEKISEEFALKILDLKVMNMRDIIQFRNDKKIISVEDIRVLNLEMLKKSENCDNRVILIYDAHKMTIEAQNAFLKSLEDSYNNIFIILIASTLEKMLNTVVSRCLLIRFGKMNFLEYKSKVIDLNLSKDELYDIYLQTKGDICKTNFILNKDYIYNLYIDILEMIKNIYSLNFIDMFEIIGKQIDNCKNYIELFIEIFLWLLRDILIYKKVKDSTLIYNRLFKEYLIDISEIISEKKIYIILNNLTEFKKRINSNLNIEMCYKIFVLKIMEV